MGDLTHYNQPVDGMKSDLSLLNTTATDYTIALNAVIEDKSGHGMVLQNEMSNTCSVSYPPGYYVIGFVEIPEQNRTIYALVNTITGGSQIGESLNCVFKGRTDKIKKSTCKDCPEYVSPELTPWEQLEDNDCYCQYYMIVSDPCLNFNIHYPVSIEYKISECGVHIYFTDYLNERRYMYFDYTDLNDSNSLLELDPRFKITTQANEETDCTCPEGYTLNIDTKECELYTQTPMQACTGTTVTVDGVNYCQTTTTINATCPPCGCPTGYTLNSATNQCVGSVTTPLVPSGVERHACAYPSIFYGDLGVKLFSTYNADGTGVFTIEHETDRFWSNPTYSDEVSGALNRCGIFACAYGDTPQTLEEKDPLNEWIGFVVPINIPQSKTYYIGIGADNEARIRLDCNVVVSMNPVTMAAQIPNHTASDTFYYWNVYPVTIPAGSHVIEVTGINFQQTGGFGAEIYDNTAAEITAAVNGAGLNTIFSTKDRIGKPLQVSTSFNGQCPDGTCLTADSLGNLVCTSVKTTPIICPPCNCPTGYTLNSATSKCVKVTEVELGVCSDTVIVINGLEYCTKTIVTDPICQSCPPIVTEDKLDCDKIRFNPIYDRPCIEFIGFVNGGLLKEGVYQVLIAYADDYGNPITEYFPASQTMSLFQNVITFETNNITSKALKVYFANLKIDNEFRYYNIVIASTVDNFTSFILAATLPTSESSYIYTGVDQSPKILTVQDVLFTRPYYELAKSITTANGYLMFAGLKEYKELNLQPVANKIKLNWETVAIKEEGYSDPLNTFYFHTYQRDEVYAFGIIFEYDNGRNAPVLHIPGRPSIPSDLDIIDNADVMPVSGCDLAVRNRRWQVYNTATLEGGDYEYNETCEVDKCWEYGQFAYWESTDTYPNIPEVWGDLVCQPIRHHKFPDSCISHIHDGSTTAKAYTDNNYIFPIGVKIDHQSVIDALNGAVLTNLITQDDLDHITSYRIVRGNRVGNKSVIAKGLLFNMFSYEAFNETYYFPNYGYNDLHDDNFLDGTSIAPQRYTFHSPDTHFVNSSLGDVLKIETEEFGKNDGYFTHSECQAKHKFLSRFAHTLAFGLGLAAAISATGKKHCKVVTYKAPYFNYIAGTYGSVPGVIATIPEITPPIVKNLGLYAGYDQVTGLIIPGALSESFALSNNEVIGDLAAEESFTMCTGAPYQVFNNPTSDVGILLAIATAGISTFAAEIIQRFYLGLVEMNTVMDTMRQLIPYYNYSVQYNSVGKYNNYTCSAVGNKVRRLDKTAYLSPIIQTIDEVTENPTIPYATIKVNNWERESSVYLKTATPLADPTNIDFSKVTMSALGLGLNDLNKHVQQEISSYYTSIKNIILDQYGQICDIDYVETSSCSFKLNTTYTGCEAKVFGGDTFINRFAIKTKMPFFTHTMCNSIDGSDVLYNKLFNVASPKYWFNTPQPLFERISDLGIGTALLSEIYDDNERSLDVQNNSTVSFYEQGFTYLFYYGIPYFLVESDVNVDYRTGQDNKGKDFYPHNADLKNWLEEAYTPISTDNTFFYNRAYSKQDKESVITKDCILDYLKFLCQPAKRNRLIYSAQDNLDGYSDNWLVFKANDYYDFDLSLGRLISADGVEDDKVLVRLEKGSKLFPAYNAIVATEGNIQVGTGGMFRTNPQDLSSTKLGYAGTQNRSLLDTEYGHIWADANSGQVFNLNLSGPAYYGIRNGLKELTQEKHRNWFKENLPFNIRKKFPSIDLDDIDNNFYGIGLHYCFDKRFSRFLVTKLDYECIDSSVVYDIATKNFTLPDGTILSLDDTNYFCNKSWTMSHSFLNGNWVSYHSYKPSFYIHHIDFFESGFKKRGNQKLYSHNVSNKSYQVFYGRLEAFMVEVISKQNLNTGYLQSFSYDLDAIRYHNQYDEFYNQLKTFNKAIVYNNTQTSGLLNLIVSDPNNESQSTNYPTMGAYGYDILVTNSEDMWRFNDFFDVSANQRNNIPLFSYDCSNTINSLNPQALNYSKTDLEKARLRSRMFKVRLINDIDSQHHFIFNFSLTDMQTSVR